MIDTLRSDNAGDFSQRYVDTYGWLYLNGKKTLVYIADCGRGRATFTMGDTPTFHVNVDSGLEFEFIQVDRGWFNTTDGKLYFLQRHPARQFKRGISASNTVVRDFRLNPVSLTYSLLASVFDPTFNYWNKKDLDTNGALSKHFAVINGSIMFYTEFIGKYADGVVTLTSTLFQQEFQDLLRRKNIDVKVVVND
jgi:hypothetical protein